MRRLFDLIEHRDGIVFHRDPALACCVAQQGFLANTELAGALARLEQCRRRQEGPVDPLFATQRGPLYLLGVVLALVSYVPILGFFATVLFGLAFIHFLLAELQATRQAPIEGEVVSVHDRLNS